VINFSKSDFNSSFGKLLRLPLKLVPAKTVLPIMQGPLKGKKWIKGSATNGCWLGTYEIEKRILFSKYVRTGMIVYDVGANVGYYTLLASMLTGSKGKVFSFEPLPANISYLKKHIELNRVKNVNVIQNAASDKVSQVRFNFGENRSSGHLSNTGEIEVETISLDEFIKQGNPEPDLIKMDIEGAEYDALVGAKDLLRNKKPVIFLATHSSEIKAKCLKLLAEFGYTVTAIDNKPIEESDDFVCQ
jgi:FkbM family methyltransferase